jgi:hypothetical protein
METIGTPGFLARGARPGIVGTFLVVLGLVAGAVALADWGLRGWQAWSGPALVVAIALVWLPIRRAGSHALERRIERVLEPWGRERGLVFQAFASNPQTTPTLDRGGTLSAVLVGAIGGDPHGFLAHYVYTVRSGKNSYDVWLSVAVVRFTDREGLRLRLGPAQPLVGDGYGFFDGWRGFDTGSAEVDEGYIVETRDGHDPVQLLELLDPVALVQLIDAEEPPMVEIDNGTLLVAYGGRIGISHGMEDLAWFDRLREQADYWGARIQGI